MKYAMKCFFSNFSFRTCNVSFCKIIMKLDIHLLDATYFCKFMVTMMVMMMMMLFLVTVQINCHGNSRNSIILCS